MPDNEKVVVYRAVADFAELFVQIKLAQEELKKLQEQQNKTLSGGDAGSSAAAAARAKALADSVQQVSARTAEHAATLKRDQDAQDANTASRIAAATAAAAEARAVQGSAAAKQLETKSIAGARVAREAETAARKDAATAAATETKSIQGTSAARDLGAKSSQEHTAALIANTKAIADNVAASSTGVSAAKAHAQSLEESAARLKRNAALSGTSPAAEVPPPGGRTSSTLGGSLPPVSDLDRWLVAIGVESRRLRNSGQIPDPGVGGAPAGEILRISGTFSGSDLLSNVVRTSKANLNAFDQTFKTIERDVERFSGSFTNTDLLGKATTHSKAALESFTKFFKSTEESVREAEQEFPRISGTFTGSELLTRAKTNTKSELDAFDRTFKTIEHDVERFSGSFTSEDLLGKATTRSKAELESFTKFYQSTEQAFRKYVASLGGGTAEDLARGAADVAGAAGGGGGGGGGGGRNRGGLGGGGGRRGGRGGGGGPTALESLLPGPTAGAPIVAAGAALGAGALGGVALSAVPALFTAIGIAAEHSNSQVSAAFKQMETSAKQATTTGFDPIVPTLLKVEKQATSTFGELTPIFGGAAHALAPLIEAVGTGFIQATKQGVGASVPILQSLGPLATAVGAGFGQVERAMIGLFKNINVQGAADGLKSLGKLLEALGPDVGTLVTALAPLGSAVLNVTSGLLTGLEPALKTVAALMNIPALPYLVASFGALEGASKLLTGSWINFGSVIKSFRRDADGSTSTMSALAQQFGLTTGAAKTAANESLHHAASLALLQRNADASQAALKSHEVATARAAAAAELSAKTQADLDAALLSQRQAVDKAAESAEKYEKATQAASKGTSTFSTAAKGLAAGTVVLTAAGIVLQHFADNSARAAQYTADIQEAASATATVLGTYGAAVDAQSVKAEKAAIAGQDWVKVLTDEGLSLDTVAKGALNSLPALEEIIRSTREAAAAAIKKLDFQGAAADYAAIITISKQYKQAQKDEEQAVLDAANAILDTSPALQKQAELTEAGTVRTTAQTAATAALAQGMTAGQARIEAYSAGVLAMGNAYLTAIKPSEDLANAQQTLQSSMNAIIDTQRQNALAATSAYQSWQSAINGVTVAQNSLVTAHQAVASAQHSEAEAAYNTREAQLNYKKSVTEETLAETDLSNARKKAVQNLIDLGLQLKDQADSQAAAQLKLYDAQVAVNNAGLAHTTMSLSDLNVAGKVNASNVSQYKLLLNLSEAQNALNDTTNTGAQLQAANNLAVAQGVNGAPSVVAAQMSLNDAQHQVATSAKAITDSQYAQRRSADATSQAVFGLSQAHVGLKTAQDNATTAQNAYALAQPALQAKIGGTSDASITLTNQVTAMFNAYAALHGQDPNLIADFEQQYATMTGSKGPVAGLDAWIQRLTGTGGLNGIVANYSVVGTPSLNLNNIITQAQALGIPPASLGFTSAQIQGAQISAGHPTATAGGTVNAQVPGGATGGKIEGWSPSKIADNIHIMATAGEYMQPVDAVEYYGTNVMEALRTRRIPRDAFAGYASGGYVNPIGPGHSAGRVDQGVDYGGAGPLYALGTGSITNTRNAGWPGGTFIGLRLNDGPNAGSYVYYAEDISPTVRVGQSVTAGQLVGDSTGGRHGIEVGWAAPPGTGESLARALGQAASKGDPGAHPTGAGVSFSNLIASLGGPPGIISGTTVGPVTFDPSGATGGITGGGPRPTVADARRLWAANIKEAIAQTMGQSVIDTMKTMGVAHLPTGLAPSDPNAQIDFGAFVPPVSPASFGAGVLAGVSGNRAVNKAIMQQVFATFGWGTGAEWAAQDYLEMREAGYDNTAQNPHSTAYGMGQFLNSLWASYGPKTSDPRLQSQYMAEYERDRYGDPIGAAAHERAYGWYGRGGLIFDPSTLYAGLSTSMPKFTPAHHALMPTVTPSNPLTVGKSGLVIDGDITVNNPVREPSAKSLRRKLELFATLGERG